MLWVRYRLFTAKKGKTVTPSRKLHAKGEMCTLQTGKLCYNAININYVLVLAYVQNCKRAQSISRVMVLRKLGVCSLFITLKLRSPVHVHVDKRQVNKVMRELHILYMG